MKLIEDLGTRFPNENSKEKVRYGIYECPVCHNLVEYTSKHIKRSGITRCVGCFHKERAKALANASFIQEATEIHEGKYTYEDVVYVTSKVKVTITCSVHGKFQQTPCNHKRGKGCPSCASYGFNPDKKAIIYYLKIEDTCVKAYKIGVTNRTVKDRFNNVDLNKITILMTQEFDKGVDALQMEQEILEQYSDFLYVGCDILQNGNTELFTKDVLGLDVI